MKEVIIYGGAGFIGSALAKELVKENVNVTVVDKKPNDDFKDDEIRKLHIRYVQYNLDEYESLYDILKNHTYDVFFQLAWNGTNRNEIVDYNKQIANINFVLDTLKLAKKLGCKRYIGAGTVNQNEIYSKQGRMNVCERHKYYRVAHMAVDLMGRALAEELGIDFFWPKITNVYGPGEKSDRLVNSIIRSLINGESVSTSDGTQLYDFIFIDDCIKAYKLIADKGITECEYTIGSGNSRQLRDYLKIINKIVNPNIILGIGELDHIGYDGDEGFFDIKDLQKLGFVESKSFENGIKETADWIRQDL